jgi:hypothetical protein
LGVSLLSKKLKIKNPRRLSYASDRQYYRHLRAAGSGDVQRDGAIVTLYDLVTDIKTQSGPLTDRFGGKKRFKNILPDSGIDTWPVVPALKDHLPGFGIVRSAQANPARSILHGLNRILDHI